MNRCNDEVGSVLLIFHELMHHSLWLHNYDVENFEEEIITWAEEEAEKVFELLNLATFSPN
jgi:hypothetical protein